MLYERRSLLHCSFRIRLGAAQSAASQTFLPQALTDELQKREDVHLSCLNERFPPAAGRAAGVRLGLADWTQHREGAAPA